MENLGKAVYEHYEKYLGEMVGADSYPELNIQLMGYQDGVENALTFATMGLTLHRKNIGTCCEAVLTTDSDYDDCASIFMDVLTYILKYHLPISPGMAIGGVRGLNPGFYQRHRKSALYFAEPTMFNAAFRQVGEDCRIYMAFFITEKEEAFLKKNGVRKFEALLEEKKADIISLDRVSVC